MTDLEQTLGLIVSGSLDDELGELEAGIKQRKEVLARKRLGELRPGDRVILTDLRPLYLKGLEATVARVDGNKVYIMLDEDAGKFSAGAEIGARPGMMRKIEANA